MDTNDGSDYDCLCPHAYQRSDYSVGILGVDLSRLIPGILIISKNSGLMFETVRAGINAVPKEGH